MQYQQTLDLWLSRAVDDPDLVAELDSVRNDADAVTERFTGIWSSAPAGCAASSRGTNRMNIYTIRRATQGLADYINAEGLPKRWPSPTTAASRA